MKLRLNWQKNLNFIGILFTTGSLLWGSVYLQKQLLKSDNEIKTIAQYQQQEQADKVNINTLKKLPSFGFDNLLADWSWLQFLNYFGDGEVREKIGYSLSPDYLESIANHDPRFVRAYFLLAPATSIFAGQPERGVKAISKGLESITPELSPEGYYLWVYKGIDEMMFLNDIEAAKKSYRTASVWAEQSDHPNAKQSAANTRQTAEFLENDPDSLIAQIGAWTMVLSSTNDTRTQEKALEKIQQLGGEIIVLPDGGVRIRVPENAT
ncbi:MAG: hypothetical protein KME09_02020 [Pleurocapsa minor HA4230-MV1]|jgi:hypothetical protein|nr:hypothetical protein [Pleurocapsa minor HA4230-MV1]